MFNSSSINNHNNEAATICIEVPNLMMFLGANLFLKIEDVKKEPNIKPQELIIKTKLKCVLDNPPASITNTGELEM